MKKVLILFVLILCVVNFVYAVHGTKYSAQNVLNMAFRDEDGNALAFFTKLSVQNVLNLCFDDTTNTIAARIVGEFVISTITNVATIYWIDGSTWTSTKINMGDVSLEYANYKITISTDIDMTDALLYLKTLDLGTNTLNDTHLGYIKGWEHASDNSKIDGEDIYDDTIDDDSIDFADVTGADLTLTDNVTILQVGVDTTTLKQEIDNLAHGQLDYYLTDRDSESSGYYLMVSSPQTGAETTFTKSITATVVVASFTFNTPLALSVLKEGTLHFHFHALASSIAKQLRISFDFYSSTGTGETFLFSSEKSNLLTTSKAGYDIHISTNDIFGTIEYFNIRVIANLSGTGANPELTFYTEGDNGTKLELPVRLEEIVTTQIIAGTDIIIIPPSGKGVVTINSDSLSKTSGTIITQNVTDIVTLAISTGVADILRTGTAGDTLVYDGSDWVKQAKGSDGQRWTVRGTSGTYETPAAGGGGNKNDDKGIPANAFYISAGGFANTGAIIREEIERTYRGLTSTDTVGWFIKLPDDKVNYADYDSVWSKQWDDGTVGFDCIFVTSSTSVGNTWIELWISTSGGTVWNVFESTTTVSSGWYTNAIATFTVASGTGLLDGIPYTLRVRKNGDDPCKQNIYIKGVIPDWDKN